MAVRPEPKLFRVEEYEALCRSGILADDDRLELINGTIIQMTPIGNRHAACVDRLNMTLAPRLAGRAIVRVQGPVTLSDLSQPQPDLSILRSDPNFYSGGHPGPADTVLMIEVADSSLAFDRSVKAALYAAAGVRELWIVDLTGSAAEVYRLPRPEGYAEYRRLTDPGDQLSPAAFPDVNFPLGDILDAQPA